MLKDFDERIRELFDENALNEMAELFPEHPIRTDYDATKLIQERVDKAVTELQSRLKIEKAEEINGEDKQRGSSEAIISLPF